MRDEQRGHTGSDVHNAVDGTVGGALVQAGTVITGGVHVHRVVRLWVVGVVVAVVAAGLAVWSLVPESGPALLVRVRPVSDPVWAWVLPGPVAEDELARVALTSVTADRDAGFLALGGVPGGYVRTAVGGVEKSANSHQISLVGNRDEPVRLIGIRTRVLRRTPPWDGTLVGHPPQAERDVRLVVTDLDDPDGAVRVQQGPGAPERPYLETKAISLPRGDDIVLQLTAAVGASHCEWELELTVAYGEEPGQTLRVRADGTETGPAFTTSAWDPTWPYRGGYFVVLPVDGPARIALERVK
ncbi:hypothetical protein [Actinokineospora terrae]|uniref:Uncharacterized protein n=1 Tax=Actinokineospora terrae TaxID=155974 RepID=A0A1H9MU72_9PSEU|nr:hypothetical protein [Actinokineospora terrae]SER27067.1 hypothetical protein SAMN04487818_102330 [Actinokineospora terrae]